MCRVRSDSRKASGPDADEAPCAHQKEGGDVVEGGAGGDGLGGGGCIG